MVRVASSWDIRPQVTTHCVILVQNCWTHWTHRSMSLGVTAYSYRLCLYELVSNSLHSAKFVDDVLNHRIQVPIEAWELIETIFVSNWESHRCFNSFILIIFCLNFLHDFVVLWKFLEIIFVFLNIMLAHMGYIFMNSIYFGLHNLALQRQIILEAFFIFAHFADYLLHLGIQVFKSFTLNCGSFHGIFK